MADLLTHVLVGYTIGTLASTAIDWRPTAVATVAMVGAILPDLAKIDILVSERWMETLLGVPFSWFALHTLGGVLVMSSIGALLVEKANRRRVFGLLLIGAFSHLILDSLLIKPSGFAKLVWWPLLTTPLPTPGWYLSSDRWPVLVAGLVAGIAWFVRYRWIDSRTKY